MQHAGKGADDAYNGGVMATCRTCRHYSGCMERDRGYPCGNYERWGSHGRDKDDPSVERKGEGNSEEEKAQS